MLGIVGVGYVGKRLLAKLNRPLWLSSRSLGTCKRWKSEGHLACQVNLDDTEGLLPWEQVLEGMFYLAPPQRAGIEDLRMEAFLRWVTPTPPKRIVYISTSGVYGDCQGRWVDESMALNPGNDRARRRVSAEQQLLEFSETYDVDIVILRVPGIYGPERLPLERLKRADPLICPEQAPFSNRIHVDDLVMCCIAAMDKGVSGKAYNVSDDEPSTMTDYFYTVADAAGIQRPPCVSLDQAEGVITAGMMSYLKESRRLDNAQIHSELGVELHYPTLDQGLAEIDFSSSSLP